MTTRIPLALKLCYTLFVALLVPCYWRHYGPANFLWFSDVALLLTVPALWLESRLLANMMALTALVPDTVWNVDYLCRLLFGFHLIGGTEYMFDTSLSLYLRNLSYFHVVLPPLLLYLAVKWGYDRRALLRQTALAWCVLLCSYLVATHETNINWVFGIGKPQEALHPLLYLVGLMVLIPLVIYLPTHLVLQRCFGQRVEAAESPQA